MTKRLVVDISDVASEALTSFKNIDQTTLTRQVNMAIKFYEWERNEIEKGNIVMSRDPKGEITEVKFLHA